MAPGTPVKTVCVFCGSSPGNNPKYLESASTLGKYLGNARIGLVYGGGGRGLMGELARSAARAGCEVTGVIPRSLESVEGDDQVVGKVRRVDDMHERKALMSRLSDAYIALPGGLGTLEELLEVASWGQLNIHHKPVVCYNVEGYFDTLKSWIQNANHDGFIGDGQRGIIQFCDTIEQVMEGLQKDSYTSYDVQWRWEAGDKI